MVQVLVTGAAGFLGSAVCRAAMREGASVLGLVRAGELVNPVGGVTYRQIDWTGQAAIAHVLSEAAPERIVHCAGATPRAEIPAAALYDANVGLVWRLLDLVKNSAPAAGVAVVSSAAVYGPSPAVPTTENEPLNPVTHYAWSKVLAEQTARAFVSADGIRVCIARPFNLIGAGEPKGSVVSDVVEQLEAGADMIRVRETASVRDFIDVDDAARALLLLAERGEPGEAYNVCSGMGVRIGDLISTVLEVAQSDALVAVAGPAAQGSVSIGSAGRLRQLGWEPGVALAESLTHVLAST